MASSYILSRRRLLASTAGFGTALLCGPQQNARAAEDAPAIVQPDPTGPAAFMDRAFAMKRRAMSAGDQPYGAVVVFSGRILGEAPSAVVTGADPTAHAEMEAIRDATRRAGPMDLVGAELYSTSRPCPMCEAAAFRAGIRRMVHGTSMADAGPPRRPIDSP